MKKVFGYIFAPSFWETLQTIAISLVLVMLLVPYPKNFHSYVMGVSLGIAAVYWMGFSRKPNRAFRFALPYLALYAAFFVACCFAGNFSRYGHYFSLLLIPFVFAGMSPDFLTPKRLRIFGFALVAGVAAGMLWKTSVSIYAYRHSSFFAVYREQGLSVGLPNFYDFYSFIVYDRYRLIHLAFEALFCNAALALTLVSWVRKDAFFGRGYRKFLAGIFVAGVMVDMLLFCTKTAAFGCLLTVFAVWIYALCQRRYSYVLSWAVVGVVMMGSLTVLRGSSIFTRFNVLTSTVFAFRNHSADVGNDGSFLPRIYAYRQGWELFKEKPVVGWGLDYGEEFKTGYNERYKEKLYRRVGSEYKPLSHPHNQVLAIMDSAGLVGLLALVWVGFSVFRDVWRRKSFFGWIWLAGLLVICAIDVLFNYTIGFIYLCGFHGILFCENVGIVGKSRA